LVKIVVLFQAVVVLLSSCQLAFADRANSAIAFPTVFLIVSFYNLSVTSIVSTSFEISLVLSPYLVEISSLPYRLK
jgi:hypothetical protein